MKFDWKKVLYSVKRTGEGVFSRMKHWVTGKLARRKYRRRRGGRQRTGVFARPIVGVTPEIVVKPAASAAKKKWSPTLWQAGIGIAAVVCCAVTTVLLLVPHGEEAGEPQDPTYRAVVSSIATLRDQVTLPFDPEETGGIVVSDDLVPGVTSPKVAELQGRLMDLEYMEEDETTEYYGPMTKQAVRVFQRKHGLQADGIAGPQTIAMLNSADAKVYSAALGDSGTDIEELQSRLKELGYMESVTGNFGELTQAAVKDFQEKNGLTADGAVNSQTREKLYSEDVKANALSIGTEGETVERIQKRLVQLGYLTQVDGKYGRDTVAAVKKFQQNSGLIADGYVGPETRSAIFSSDAQPNALILGSTGSDVQKAQERLKSLGYMKKVTGYYGSDTEAAVKSFQSRNGLTADGKLGAKTSSVLYGKNAKKAGSSSGTSSNKSGVEKLIAVAESKLGCRYVWGAKGPNKFDCSGFAYYCLNQAGVRQGYMTSITWRSCKKYKKITKMSDIRRGDIIIYTGRTSAHGHVGIAVSNSTMIDASSSKGKVVKRSFRHRIGRITSIAYSGCSRDVNKANQAGVA